MTGDQQSAVAALKVVEHIAARMDRARDGEDRAADILELWHGTETALRALIGGSSLSGQGLIRELRQREMITLGQAYALLEFLGARDRANRTTYRATDNDVVVAREGFRQLESGLAVAVAEPAAPPLPPRPAEAAAAPPPYSPGAAASAAGGAALGAAAMRSAPPPPPPPAYSQPMAQSAPQRSGNADAIATEPLPSYESRASRLPPNSWLIAALVLLVLGSLAGFWMFSQRSDPAAEMNEAVSMMQGGRREAARGQFSTIARDNPELATPHVFLSRLAREEGDLATARRELETAIRLEPTNAIALREMGLILFSAGNYEVARRFFVRAIQSNPADKASQGYLGCALARLNRVQEAQTFLSRAGPGSWSSCLPQRPL
ncbi:MAG: tetratricopeptide repeat protein [Gemmatimonadaceae bacterium]|nr:tetratricopeptide repeat protein [Gemmatimonadaceae bacterium]